MNPPDPDPLPTAAIVVPFPGTGVVRTVAAGPFTGHRRVGEGAPCC